MSTTHTITAVALPTPALNRLYRLANRWGVSKDRALLFMIDEFSKRLSVAEWELADLQATQEMDATATGGTEELHGVDYGLWRFRRRLHEVRGQTHP